MAGVTSAEEAKVFQECLDTSDLTDLSPTSSLFLKPIARLNITVTLPQLRSGQAISNWEVMQKLRAAISPEIFTSIKITKSTLEFLRFDAELDSRKALPYVIGKIDQKGIRLGGFTELLKIRAVEAKVPFPSKHDWDVFFRDAKHMNEMKPGERPDTVMLDDLPCSWFAHMESMTAAPSAYVLKKIFESFGEVRMVDLPCLDPYRHQMSSSIAGISKAFSFGQDIFFKAYVQFKEYIGFAKCMHAFQGKKLVSVRDKTWCTNIKVDFDRTKHLSEYSIKKRAAEKEKLMATQREAEERQRRQKEMEELKLQAERMRIEEEGRHKKEELEKAAQEKDAKRKLREGKRRERRIKIFGKEGIEGDPIEDKFALKIAMEERKLLIAQRKLESIRLLDELFERIKIDHHKDIVKLKAIEGKKQDKDSLIKSDPIGLVMQSAAKDSSKDGNKDKENSSLSTTDLSSESDSDFSDSVDTGDENLQLSKTGIPPSQNPMQMKDGLYSEERRFHYNNRFPHRGRGYYHFHHGYPPPHMGGPPMGPHGPVGEFHNHPNFFGGPNPAMMPSNQGGGEGEGGEGGSANGGPSAFNPNADPNAPPGEGGQQGQPDFFRGRGRFMRRPYFRFFRGGPFRGYWDRGFHRGRGFFHFDRGGFIQAKMMDKHFKRGPPVWFNRSHMEEKKMLQEMYPELLVRSRSRSRSRSRHRHRSKSRSYSSRSRSRSRSRRTRSRSWSDRSRKSWSRSRSRSRKRSRSHSDKERSKSHSRSKDSRSRSKSKSRSRDRSRSKHRSRSRSSRSRSRSRSSRSRSSSRHRYHKYRSRRRSYDRRDSDPEFSSDENRRHYEDEWYEDYHGNYMNPHYFDYQPNRGWGNRGNRFNNRRGRRPFRQRGYWNDRGRGGYHQNNQFEKRNNDKGDVQQEGHEVNKQYHDLYQKYFEKIAEKETKDDRKMYDDKSFDDHNTSKHDNHYNNESKLKETYTPERPTQLHDDFEDRYIKYDNYGESGRDHQQRRNSRNLGGVRSNSWDRDREESPSDDGGRRLRSQVAITETFRNRKSVVQHASYHQSDDATFKQHRSAREAKLQSEGNLYSDRYDYEDRINVKDRMGGKFEGRFRGRGGANANRNRRRNDTYGEGYSDEGDFMDRSRDREDKMHHKRSFDYYDGKDKGHNKMDYTDRKLDREMGHNDRRQDRDVLDESGEDDMQQQHQNIRRRAIRKRMVESEEDSEDMRRRLTLKRKASESSDASNDDVRSTKKKKKKKSDESKKQKKKKKDKK